MMHFCSGIKSIGSWIGLSLHLTKFGYRGYTWRIGIIVVYSLCNDLDALNRDNFDIKVTSIRIQV